MPKQDIVPAIRVGDKVVQVGSLSWRSLKNVVGTFEKVELPLPNLSAEGIKEQLALLQGQNGVRIMDLLGIAYQFVASNTQVLWSWFLKHPPLVDALVVGASNLNSDEIADLSAADTVRIARAAWTALVDDGFFTEVGGFFGGLLGATKAPSGGPSQNQNDGTPQDAPAGTAAP